MEETDRIPLISPKSELPDLVQSIICGGVPYLAGAAQVLADRLRPSAYSRRLEAWCEEVTHALNELSVLGITVDTLMDDDRFIAATSRATRLALEAASADKLRLLRNVLHHSAPQTQLDDATWEQMFALAERLSTYQVQLLAAFTVRPSSTPGECILRLRSGLRLEPDTYRATVDGCLEAVGLLDDANRRVARIAWRDLQSLGLVTLDLYDSVVNPPVREEPDARGAQLREIVMPEGEAFLDFVAEPGTRI